VATLMWIASVANRTESVGRWRHIHGRRCYPPAQVCTGLCLAGEASVTKPSKALVLTWAIATATPA